MVISAVVDRIDDTRLLLQLIVHRQRLQAQIIEHARELTHALLIDPARRRRLFVGRLRFPPGGGRGAARRIGRSRTGSSWLAAAPTGFSTLLARELSLRGRPEARQPVWQPAEPAAHAHALHELVRPLQVAAELVLVARDPLELVLLSVELLEGLASELSSLEGLLEHSSLRVRDARLVRRSEPFKLFDAQVVKLRPLVEPRLLLRLLLLAWPTQETASATAAALGAASLVFFAKPARRAAVRAATHTAAQAGAARRWSIDAAARCAGATAAALGAVTLVGIAEPAGRAAIGPATRTAAQADAARCWSIHARAAARCAACAGGARSASACAAARVGTSARAPGCRAALEPRVVIEIIRPRGAIWR